MTSHMLPEIESTPPPSPRDAPIETSAPVMAVQQTPSPRWSMAGAIGALLLFSLLFWRDAWILDDAYITFRTIDNAVNGFGLRWNIAERVQSYTHPLWMFLIASVHWVTRELFFTTLALSWVLGIAALEVLRRGLDRRATTLPLLFLTLSASKAFMDYASSGLENPLSNLLAALFLVTYLRGPGERPARWLWLLTLLTSLAFLNRMDTVLLYAPALAEALWRLRAILRPIHMMRPLLAGGAPALGWLLFATFYYGFPFPNTYYAKAGNNGISTTDKIKSGLEYFSHTLQWDSWTLLLIAAGLISAIVRRNRNMRMLAAGVGLYLMYILRTGAASTHMGGRFFALPLFVSAALVLLAVQSQRLRGTLLGSALLFAILGGCSPWKANTSLYRPLGPNHDGNGRNGYWDIRYMATNEGAALIRFKADTKAPNHKWYRDGEAFRSSPEAVKVGGGSNGYPIGYFGTAVGPDKFIIDVLGLSDPLLARLPMAPGTRWYPGHYKRPMPAGYVDSCRSGYNSISDPDLHTYVDRLWLVTRGPLLSAARLREIVRFNMGGNDDLVRAWVNRTTPPK